MKPLLPSSSVDLPILPRRQVFEPAICQRCHFGARCVLRGTTLQCPNIDLGESIPQGCYQPGVPNAEFVLAEAGGTDIKLEGAFSSADLPGLVHRVVPEQHVGAAADDLHVVAVSVKNLLRQRGATVLTKQTIIRACRFHEATKVILAITGSDRDLASLSQFPRRFVQSVHEAKFDLVLGPAFSVWDGDPPWHNSIEAIRSARWSSALAQRGIPVIPAVVAYQSWELEAYVRAINANHTIKTVWVDLQTVPNGRRPWRRAIAELDSLLHGLRPGVSLIVYGVADPTRVRELRSRPQIVAVIHSRAFMLSVKSPVDDRGAEFQRLVATSDLSA